VLAAGAVADELFSDLPDEDEPDVPEEPDEDAESAEDPFEADLPDSPDSDFAPADSLSFFFAPSPDEPLRLSVR